MLQALQNRLDPVIGRSREVARVMQILARRRKNNPMLLGEPGVGKTAIAEGLALAIVNGKGDDGTELPPFLKGGRLHRPRYVPSCRPMSGSPQEHMQTNAHGGQASHHPVERHLHGSWQMRLH